MNDSSARRTSPCLTTAGSDATADQRSLTDACFAELGGSTDSCSLAASQLRPDSSQPPFKLPKGFDNSDLAAQRNSIGWLPAVTSIWYWSMPILVVLLSAWYWQSPRPSHALPATNSLAGVRSRPQFQPKRIADIKLGERVAGINPIRSEADSAEPDADTWRRIALVMEKENGAQLEIELLRPTAWIEENNVRPGYSSFLSLPEMGAVGQVDVVSVGSCPPITPGTTGAVVTGRFVHECRDASLVRITIEGQSEPVGVTDNHRYWSVDRQCFIEVGCLRPGERVDTVAGERRVIAVVPYSYSGLLYNLETTEHVYRVGSLGTLVHNACKLTPYGKGGGHHPLMVSAFEDHPKYKKYRALAISTEELDRLGIQHVNITNSQNRMFWELARSGGKHTMDVHVSIAIKALVENGMSRRDAKSVVSRCLEQLKSWGITEPLHQPWNP